MTPLPRHILPAVAVSLERWHLMVAGRNMRELASIARHDAVFRSPVANTPYGSAQALALALETVVQVFEDFTYHRQFVSDDGLSVVLEFSARVGDKSLKGVDLIRFDEEGRIAEFEVAIRPLSGLVALAEKMGARLGGRLDDFRQSAV